MANTTKILGSVPTPRGAYSNSENYYKFNEVQYQNCTYGLKVDGPVRGVLPTDTSKWTLKAGVSVVQETGDSETYVMSQRAVSDGLLLRSARTVGNANPTLSPLLENEVFVANGQIVKLEEMPDGFRNIGLEYFFKKTKSSGNLEAYINCENLSVLPAAGQYVRCSYIVFGLDNPPLNVTNTSQSKARLLIVSSPQQQIYPIKANVTKLFDKAFRVDTLYRMPDDYTSERKFWQESVFEDDGTLPTGTSVYISDINIVYSDDLLYSMDNGNSLTLIEAVDKKIDGVNGYILSKSGIDSAIGGGNFASVKDVLNNQFLYFNTENVYLNNIGITVIASRNKNQNGNIELYANLTTDKINEYFNNSGKYITVKWHVFSKDGVMSSIGAANRLGVLGIEDAVSYSNRRVTYKQVDSQVFEVTASWKINQSVPPSYIWIATVWESALIPDGYMAGDFGVTGFGVWYSDSEEILSGATLEFDWLEYPGLNASEGKVRRMIDSSIENISKGAFDTPYNNVSDIQKNIAVGLKQLKNRWGLMNQHNRVLVSFNGDSIIGAQLDDITHADGYDTGDFPPNMSKNIIARKFFDKYRFEDEDVLFRNLVHSDWVKQGFNVSNGKGDKAQTFNEIEVYGCNGADDYAEITVAGKKYVKFVWSEYKSAAIYSFDIMQCVDGGEETLLDTVDVNNNRRLMIAYKIIEIEPAKSYKFRIVPKSGYEKICFWGIEAWSKPRLDVVVEAFSGSTLKQAFQNKIDGYFSDFHKPALLIADTLILNDSSYITNSSDKLEDWVNNMGLLSDLLRKNGVPSIFFIPHHPAVYNNTFLIDSVKDVAFLNGLNVIDIPTKQVAEPPASSIVNAADGLHLSDYGQTYYFEELERIIDNFI